MVFVKGPGLYSDIGKRARDLLYKDYQGDHKFSLTTYPSDGLSITSSGFKKGDLFSSDISFQCKNKLITADSKVETKGKVHVTVTLDELAPGVKAIFSSTTLDRKSQKLELQYFHEFAGISTSIALLAKPTIYFSGVVGDQNVSFGTDVAFDTATGNFTNYNAGVSFINTDLIVSLIMNNRGESVTASYVHRVAPSSNTAVGAEFTHNFSTGENTLHLGAHHLLDPQTAVKARVNNYGKASALIQHEWRPNSFITISGEVDTRAIEKSAKIGLAVALKS